MTEPQINPIQSADVPPADQATPLTTIYQVSGWQIFWRNFLAGFSRAFGSLILYFVVFFVIAGLANYYLMPYLKPLVGTLSQTFETINQLSPQRGQDLVNPIMEKPALQNILNQTK